MPCAMTPGSPTDVATRSFQWIGLKSPEAPAYADEVGAGDVVKVCGAKSCRRVDQLVGTALICVARSRRRAVHERRRTRSRRARRRPSATSVRVPIMSVPADRTQTSIVIVPSSTSPARTGRVYVEALVAVDDSAVARCPTLGSVISCVIAPNGHHDRERQRRRLDRRRRGRADRLGELGDLLPAHVVRRGRVKVRPARPGSSGMAGRSWQATLPTTRPAPPAQMRVGEPSASESPSQWSRRSARLAVRGVRAAARAVLLELHAGPGRCAGSSG